MLLSFFFSSRRRHTRWPRDWSSDVCSSDLWVVDPLREISPRLGLKPTIPQRSEERRVGKEGRTRWSSYQEEHDLRGPSRYPSQLTWKPNRERDLHTGS